MPRLSSKLRRKQLSDRLRASPFVAMPFPCSCCKRAKAQCQVSLDAPDCIRCTGNGSTCDINFSERQWKSLSSEERRLELEIAQADSALSDIMRQLSEASGRLARLRMRREMVQKKKQKLVSGELAVISQLENLEAQGVSYIFLLLLTS